MMTPRCFFAVDGTEPFATEETEATDETGPPTGGEIFSNVKAGIVVPLFVELNTPGISPDRVRRMVCDTNHFIPV